MKICIESDPQTGGYVVYQEVEQPAEMTGETPATEQSEQQGAQKARDVQSALQIAGKMLSGEQQQADGAGSPFDQGLKSVLPQRQGMM